MFDDPLVRALRLLEVRPRRLALAVAAGVASLGSALALAGVAAWLIARAWQMPPILDLSVAVVAVRALGISRGVFRYLERLASHDTAFRGAVNARSAIYRRLAAGEPAAVTGMRRGMLLTRTGDDVETVAAVVVRAVVPIAVAVVLAIAAVGLLASISGLAAVILAGALALSGIVAPVLASRAARSAEEDAMASAADYAVHAVTTLDHAAELRVAGRLGEVVGSARSASVLAAAASDRAARGNALAAAATPLAIGASVVGSLLIGLALYGPGGGSPGGMTPMALAVLVLVPLAAFEAVAPLPAAAQALTRARIAARRVVSLVDRAGVAVEQGQGDTTDWVVRARRLRSGWPDGKSTAPIDLDLARGARVAVVGASGAGKTTLLMTLAGLLEPVEGRITLDGKDLRDIAPDAVRRRVTFFAEDAHLFDTTLLENLRVARGSLTELEAEDALRSVGLGEWLDGLAAGVETVLVGGDRAVSGGQRRRILLARAIVSPADVLLLDEPTEHLDAREGAELLRRLLDRGSGLLERRRTVVVVTHQLPSDSRPDQVISLDYAERENALPISSGPRTFGSTRERRWSEVGYTKDM